MNQLEERILNSLEAIGYNGPMLKKPNFPLAVEGGPKNIEYTQLVNFLTNEIRTLLGIDEEVNPITAPEDSAAFIMEITSFLKELNCPYKSLMQGHVSDRLQNVGDRLLLIDYLVNELMAARILQEKKPEKKIELKIQETPEGKDMRLILQTLRFPKPPANISITTLFQKLCPTIPIVLSKAGKDIIGKCIFDGYLSESQWQTLNDVCQDLYHEYKIRRQMLLTRLDVTIQSFEWSDRTKGREEMFEKIYHDKRRLLNVEPDVDIADLLAARDDLAIIEKTSSVSVRKNTRSQLNKVIIGMVPDRGGRTSEIAPPPPEMPSWQQRQPGGGGFGGGGRGGGGRGGGNFGNRGGGNQNYSRGGGNSFSGGGNSYSGGGGGGGYQANQNRGGYDNNFSQKSFDSAGSYDNRFGNQGGYGGNKSSYSDTRGGYGNDRGGGGGYGNDRGESFGSDRGGGYGSDNRGSYDNNRGSSRGGYNDERRGSGGSYSSQDFQQSKRAKTYDSFQASKTTYADQYVQERQHNQQYSSRGDNRDSRGGGKSNYNRGGRGGYR